ncbi:cytochrome C [Parasulfuritortus cantonensis]|uniref:Cytochrome C n=1 Tax=Parasulfuritortus cantonensis TaxID=2528202 RepID=A0A4R1BLU1_9PROT|nr:cytochrome C [Parasulfuritortus cantonensis]
MASFLGTALAWLALAAPAHALPSFARQTGEECAACHIGAFGPQLTPHGMRFKLEGYSETDGKSGKIPLSAMLVASSGHSKADGNSTPSLQEASLFLGGRLADHLGAFVQATTDGHAQGKFSMDNVDVRYARTVDLKDGDLLLGLSLNNNPSVTDPLNTAPAWRFPYMSAELQETPSPLLAGGMEMQVGGANAYALWNNVYAELGLYRTLPSGFLNDVNVDLPDQKISGVAPYWRLAYLKDNHKDAWSVGLMGMNTKLVDRITGGPSDKYNDIGVDATYTYLGDRKNIFGLNAAYMHERQTLDASDDGAKVNLNRFDVSGSWHYDNTYGLTAGLFDTSGTGSENDSRGYILQADWTPWGKEGSWGAPWANVRLGVQYTGYTKLGNYDDKASDHNTLYGFIWTSF